MPRPLTLVATLSLLALVHVGSGPDHARSAATRRSPSCP